MYFLNRDYNLQQSVRKNLCWYRVKDRFNSYQENDMKLFAKTPHRIFVTLPTFGRGSLPFVPQNIWVPVGFAFFMRVSKIFLELFT